MKIIYVDFGFENVWKVVWENNSIPNQKEKNKIYAHTLKSESDSSQKDEEGFLSFFRFFSRQPKETIEYAYIPGQDSASTNSGTIKIDPSILADDAAVLKTLHQETSLPKPKAKTYELSDKSISMEMEITGLRLLISNAEIEKSDGGLTTTVRWIGCEVDAIENSTRTTYQYDLLKAYRIPTEIIVAETKPPQIKELLLESINSNKETSPYFNHVNNYNITSKPDLIILPGKKQALGKAIPGLLSTIFKDEQTQVRIEAQGLYRYLGFAAGSLGVAAVAGCLYFVPVLAASIIAVGIPPVLMAGVLLTLFTVGVILAGVSLGFFAQEFGILSQIKDKWDRYNTKTAEPHFIPT